MTDSDFIEWLKTEDGGRCTEIKIIGGGLLYVAAKPLMFHWTMIVGQIGDTFSFEDRFCYANQELAEKAVREWDGTGEPTGWHRNPKTGRRRVNGDPKTEYIEW